MSQRKQTRQVPTYRVRKHTKKNKPNKEIPWGNATTALDTNLSTRMAYTFPESTREERAEVFS